MYYYNYLREFHSARQLTGAMDRGNRPRARRFWPERIVINVAKLTKLAFLFSCS